MVGACEGQVLPAASEDCTSPDDDDCNGSANDGCTCAPGEARACYTGPAGTLGVGPCVLGQQACLADGTGFGACSGDVTPQPDTCLDGIDQDCDGLTDEEPIGCACVPGSIRTCYTGPQGTLDVGVCRAGFATCKQDGSGFGDCLGEATPIAEDCNNTVDEDCDGKLSEEGDACVCHPGDTTPCYTGPAGTEDVGLCKGGALECTPNGMGFAGECLGEVTPKRDNCALSGDESCGGSAKSCNTLAWAIFHGSFGTSSTRSSMTGLANGKLLWIAGDESGTAATLRWLAAADGQTLSEVVVAHPPCHVWWSEVVEDGSGHLYARGLCGPGSHTFAGVTLTVPPEQVISVLFTLSANGQPAWFRGFGRVYTGGPPRPHTLVGLSSGGVVAAVTTEYAHDFGSGSMDGCVAVKFDGSGNYQWSRRSRFGYTARCTYADVSASGRVALVSEWNGGYFSDVFSDGGALDSSTQIGAGALLWRPAGGYWTPSSELGRFAADGSALWSASTPANLAAIITHDDRLVTLGVVPAPTYAAIFGRVDASGTVLGQWTLDPFDTVSIAADSLGAVFVSGFTDTGSVKFGDVTATAPTTTPHAFVMKVLE